jgi:Family of unknown function (DUF5719)
MFSLRRFPLLLAVALVLVGTGALTSLRHAPNPSVLPSGLAVSIDAESTALYCTGLSNTAGAPGRITFYNTSNGARSLSVSIVSDRGETWNGAIELAGHQSQSIEPSVIDKNTSKVKVVSYGVAVQISGGGVVGEEVAGTNRAEVPCVAGGLTHWLATGFNTLVHSDAYLSVYNPTATSAVLNASIYSTAGVSAPESFQGLSVPAHTQSEIDLGTQVVNTPNFGVSVDVLRGSLEIVGIEDSNGTLSYEQGETKSAEDAWYPNVTTVNKSNASIMVTNPSAVQANVSVTVALGKFKIPVQNVSVAPFSTGSLTITPNSAIPAAGYANVKLHSNVPVVSALASGDASVVLLSSPSLPGNAFLVKDFSTLGFDAATMTNTSSHTITVSIVTFSTTTTNVASAAKGVKLAPGATESLESTLTPSFSVAGDAYLISASKPSLVVSLTLPSAPTGVDVVSPLDGR